VTGNLQSSILKISASGVQTLFATISNVNFSAEGLAIRSIRSTVLRRSRGRRSVRYLDRL
jgi:hypothetical protein